MFVSLCNEMNGNWFPWSARYYGAGAARRRECPATVRGTGIFQARLPIHRGPGPCAGCVQRPVDVSRQQLPRTLRCHWNALAQYYPGRDYVDWLGLSVYGQMYPG